MSSVFEKKRIGDKFDFLLLFVVLTLSFVGLMNLNSATLSFPDMTPSVLFKSQKIYTLLGLVVMMIVSFLRVKTVLKLSVWLYGASIVALILVLILGSQFKGSQSWIDFGFFRVQPSEFAKLGFILFFARYMSKQNYVESLGLKDLFVPCLILLGPVILIILQGDLGTSLFFGFIFISMVMVQGVRLRLIVLAVILLVTVSVFSYFFLLKEYQQLRILSFMNPELDARGSGYHLVQSKIAVGSGEWLGRGYLKGESNKLKYLPERHTDFVFPVLAQEWGFVGCCVTLSLYLGLLLLGIRTLNRTQSLFAFFVGLGIVSLIFWHLVINLGGVLGLIPLTGVPLPLFSYGGSSLLTTWMSIGVLNALYRDRFS